MKNVIQHKRQTERIEHVVQQVATLYEQGNTLTETLTIPSNRNGMLIGPVTISGTITVNGTLRVV